MLLTVEHFMNKTLRWNSLLL